MGSYKFLRIISIGGSSERGNDQKHKAFLYFWSNELSPMFFACHNEKMGNIRCRTATERNDK